MQKNNEWLIAFGKHLLIAIAIYFIGRLIVRYMVKWVTKGCKAKNVEPSLMHFMVNIFKTVLYVCIFLGIVMVFGFNFAAISTIMAALILAIGMALTGTIQHLAGGWLVMLDTSYILGDDY